MNEFKSCNEEGRMAQVESTVRIQGAVIEEIFTNSRVNFIIVSYGVISEFQMIKTRFIRLVVGRGSTILDRWGRSLSMGDLRKDMVINTEFSPAMTASVPPQAMCNRIIVVGMSDPVNVRIDRVLSINSNNNIMTTGNPDDITNQMKYIINSSTRVLNRLGHRIGIRNIRDGNIVRIEHAIFQTVSVPPQTIAYRIQLLD